MKDNMLSVKSFIEQLRTLVPGEVKRVTFAIGDGGLDFDAWNNNDETLVNVVIGDRGSGTFTVAEAKAAEAVVLKRVAKDILGLTNEEKGAQLKVAQADRELQAIAQKRINLADAELDANAKLDEEQAVLDAKKQRVRTQLEAQRAAFDKEEADWIAYRLSVLSIEEASDEIDSVGV